MRITDKLNQIFFFKVTNIMNQRKYIAIMYIKGVFGMMY